MNWKLNIGVARDNSIASRDSHTVTNLWDNSGDLSTLDDCRSTLACWRDNYTQMGCRVSWAEAIDPHGVYYKLE